MQSGRNRHLVHSSKPQQGPSLMPLSGVMAGYPCFVRHALLEKHARRYLLNDCLIVRYGGSRPQARSPATSRLIYSMYVQHESCMQLKSSRAPSGYIVVSHSDCVGKLRCLLQAGLWVVNARHLMCYNSLWWQHWHWHSWRGQTTASVGFPIMLPLLNKALILRHALLQPCSISLKLPRTELLGDDCRH